MQPVFTGQLKVTTIGRLVACTRESILVIPHLHRLRRSHYCVLSQNKRTYQQGGGGGTFAITRAHPAGLCTGNRVAAGAQPCIVNRIAKDAMLPPACVTMRVLASSAAVPVT